MERSVAARSAARSAAAERFGNLAPRILIALAVTLMTAYSLVAAESYLSQVFGPLPDADLLLVLQ